MGKALESANETLSYAPDSVDSRVVLAASLVETGREDAAINIGNEILGLDPTFELERYESTHPFREKDVVDRITGSLRQAGLDNRNVKLPSYGFSSSSRRRLVPQRKH